MAPRPLLGALLKRLPPWLQGTRGTQLLGGIGDVVDAHVQRVFESALLRFPRAVETTALPYIGRDRLIRRGPSEPASSYAARLIQWWTDHQVRGGPHGLLRQYHAFLRFFAPGQIDLIYQSGTRYSCDETTGAIQRETPLVWTGDGQSPGTPVLLAGNADPGDLEIRPVSIATFPTEGRYRLTLTNGTTSEEVFGVGTDTEPYGRIVLEEPGVVGTYLAGPSSVRRELAVWARAWVVVQLTGLVTTTLCTEDDEDLLCEDGETLDGEVPPWVGAFDDLDNDVWTAVPREWSAAHIDRLYVVILYGSGSLWDFPVPVPTYDADDDGAWDDDPPIFLTLEA
jgi:hypothetical protein